MKKLIGFQPLERDTFKYPEDVFSFMVYTHEGLDLYLDLHPGNNFILIPIYEDTIEEPTIIGRDDNYVLAKMDTKR